MRQRVPHNPLSLARARCTRYAPLMTIRRVLAAAALVTLTGACVGEGRLQSWGLQEVRVALPALHPLGEAGELEFHVSVPTGVARDRLAVAAEGSLVIGDGAMISGARADKLPVLSGLGAVSIGSGARVGSVYGGAQTSILLHAGSTVEGYIKGSQKVVVHEAVSLGVGVLEDFYDPGEAYQWTVVLPAGADGSEAAVGSDAEALAPGAYAGLAVAPGSRAVLRNGHYFFRSLAVSKGGTLEIDDSEGAVYVWVRDQLALAELPHCSALPRFLLGFAGSAELSLEAGFCGTLAAPSARLTLAGARSTYLGSFFAQSIEVASHTTIRHEPFMWWRKP
jgi:hypothetical protein